MVGIRSTLRLRLWSRPDADAAQSTRPEPNSGRTRLPAGQLENRVGHPPLESLVVHELLEQLGVVLHQGGHEPEQRLAVLDAGVLVVGVLPGIPGRGVLGHAGPDRRRTRGRSRGDSRRSGPRRRSRGATPPPCPPAANRRDDPASAVQISRSRPRSEVLYDVGGLCYEVILDWNSSVSQGRELS